MIVLDANILIRAVLGRRVRQLVDTYTAQGVRFLAPDVAFGDAQKYLPPLLKKRGKPDADVSASLEYLRLVVETIDSELYAVFEKEARQRLRGRDEDDWPVLATVLALSCAVLDGGCGLLRNWHCSMDYRSHRDLSTSTNQSKTI
jgi:predicted nucleic acid-binding protein